VANLHTDFNPRASSLGLDFEPFVDGFYDEAVGPICGRKWSKAPLACGPYVHIPLHEVPADYLSHELVFFPDEGREEDDDFDDYDDDDYRQPTEPFSPDKYEEMASRYELQSRDWQDDLNDDIDEDFIGRSLPRCEGVHKGVTLASGERLRRECKRPYGHRGRTQFFYRIAHV